MANKNVVRWAIVGTGRISESFAPDLDAVPGAVVSSVWGRRAEAAETFARTHGIARWSTDLDAAMGGGDVDAVYVATPPATHASIALRAIELGKHVLIEKPMGMDADEIAGVFDAAHARGVFCMEAMWMKFNPLHRDLLDRVAGGAIGQPRSVRAAFGMPFPAGGSRWDAALGGSTVLDQGIYAVTLAHWALGPASQISAVGVVRDGVDVAVHATVEHEGGAHSQVACAITEFVDPSASISGTSGWISIPAMFWATDQADVHAGSPQALFSQPERVVHARRGNGYVPMIEEVVAAISRGALLHEDHGRDATLGVARTLDVIRDQVHRAARSGEVGARHGAQA